MYIGFLGFFADIAFYRHLFEQSMMQGVLFKSPDLNVLHIEVFCFREHWISKGLTWVSSAMIEVSIQPQTKLTPV